MDALDVMSVLKMILANLGIPEDSIHRDTLLYKDLQVDSVEVVEFSLAIKQRLGVKVKLESRHDITLSQVCDLVEAAMIASPDNATQAEINS